MDGLLAISAASTARERSGHEPGVYTFRLGYRPPYNWASMIGFLAPRAIPGVETITLDEYRRSIFLDGNAGFITVRPVFAKNYLELQIEFPEPAALFRIVERVRNIFDLRADPADVDGHLRRDPNLKAIVQSRAGMRVPGCWEGFEIAVRAILGQQISVKGATTMAGRLATEFGKPIGDARLFPTADALADADLTRIGLTKQRAHSIREIAAAVARKEVSFDASLGLESLEERLTQLPGIGPWTAQYIAMRTGEPDAFPAGDLYLRKFHQGIGGVASLESLRRDVHLERKPMNYTYLETPIGTLLIAGDTDAVRRIDFPKNGKASKPEVEWTQSERGPVGQAAKQLREYFAGKRADFDLPLAPEGTEFQRTVWRNLQEIPYGETISYGELAKRVGNPKASRAVGPRTDRTRSRS